MAMPKAMLDKMMAKKKGAAPAKGGKMAYGKSPAKAAKKRKKG
jgi:hypothetical protein